MLWTEPAAHPDLPPSQVHVWRARLASLRPRAGELWAFLNAVERARAERFAFDSDRQDYIVARGTLRLLLSRYLETEPANVAILTAASGKPFAAESCNEKRITFNLSHSHGLCLVAIGQGLEMGVDVEKIREDVSFADLAERYFAPAEISTLGALEPNLRALGFWLVWTRKEAYLKARGSGLSESLDTFAVTADPAALPRLVSDDSDRWVLVHLEPGEDFVGALVAEKPLTSVTYWTFNG